jgi:hypothetical protein
MSLLRRLARITMLCSTVFMLMEVSARSQETPHLPTIADCPAGYTLGVQDIDAAQPLVKSSDPYAYTVEGAAQYDKTAASAPKAFITGCIPPRPVQPVYQTQQR